MTPVDPCIPLDDLPAGTVARVYAKDQAEYTPLPAVRTPSGTVITRWRLNDDDLRRLLRGDDIYLALTTFNQPLQPILMQIGPRSWKDL